MALATPALTSIGGVAGLEEKLAAFAAAENVRVRRSLEGIGKIIDVKQFVTNVTLGTEETRDAIRRAGLVGNLVPLAVAVRIMPNGSAKIAEIVEAITGDATFRSPLRPCAWLSSEKASLRWSLAAHKREKPPAGPAPIIDVAPIG